MAEKKNESTTTRVHQATSPSVFSGMAPKASFFFGLLSGVAAMSLIGFIVTATFVMREPKTTAAADGTVAGATAQQPSANDVADPQGNPDAIRAITDADHVRGPKDAKITLVEYSDFQCPFCQRVHPTLEQLMKDYDGKIRWVYRHFPLESIHPQARPAANASECIASLGGNDAFWEFADAIYADQSNMTDATYRKAAVDLGIDGKKFDDCYTNRTLDGNIQRDADEGTSAGVQGTPATFVNGTLISGALPLDQFKSVIESLL